MSGTELLPVEYTCPWCGERNEILVDPTGGDKQDYTEDCGVCCRPSTLSIRIDDDRVPQLTVEPES